jgi:hypothetical protein
MDSEKHLVSKGTLLELCMEEGSIGNQQTSAWQILPLHVFTSKKHLHGNFSNRKPYEDPSNQPVANCLCWLNKNRNDSTLEVETGSAIDVKKKIILRALAAETQRSSVTHKRNPEQGCLQCFHNYEIMIPSIQPVIIKYGPSNPIN